MARPEDQSYHRRNWKVQRATFWLMGVLLAVGIAGGFGGGPLSRRTIGRDGVSVRYDRIWRQFSDTEVEVVIRPVAGTAVIALDRELVRELGDLKVSPAPLDVVSESSRLVYRFPVAGAGPAIVTFRLRPAHAGRLRTWIVAGAADTIPLSILVLP